MKRCVVIQHVAFENLGVFAQPLEEAGFAISYVQAGVVPLTHELWKDADLAVILGGPIGVYQDDLYPFLTEEKALVAGRLASGRPLLGICLGAQMLARQLGATVAPHHEGRVEVGYYPIRPTAEGHALSPDWPERVYHWHGEGFELPDGAKLLAEGDDFPVQAYQHGHAFGFQFHPDVTYAMMHRWTTRGHERLLLPGARARAEHFTSRFIYDLAERAWLAAFLDGWLHRPPRICAAIVRCASVMMFCMALVGIREK